MELEYGGLVVEVEEPQFTTDSAEETAAERDGMNLALAEACMPAVVGCRRLRRRMAVEKAEVELGFSSEGNGDIFIRKVTFVGEAGADTDLGAKLVMKVSEDESQLLPPDPEQGAKRIGAWIGQGASLSGVQARWADFITDMVTGGVPMDLNALVQAVLREAYMEQNKALQFYAEKVKYFNEQKKQVRDELARMREYRRGFTEQLDAHTDSMEKRLPTLGDDAQLAHVDPQNVLQKQVRDELARIRKYRRGFTAQLDEHIDSMEKRLATLEDAAQLDTLDLQDALNKQQQAMQMMSNIMKMMHDTAKAIIRNLK